MPRQLVSVESELHTQLHAQFQFCNFYGWMVALIVRCECICCQHTVRSKTAETVGLTLCVFHHNWKLVSKQRVEEKETNKLPKSKEHLSFAFLWSLEESLVHSTLFTIFHRCFLSLAVCVCVCMCASAYMHTEVCVPAIGQPCFWDGVSQWSGAHQFGCLAGQEILVSASLALGL